MKKISGENFKYKVYRIWTIKNIESFKYILIYYNFLLENFNSNSPIKWFFIVFIEKSLKNEVMRNWLTLDFTIKIFRFSNLCWFMLRFKTIAALWTNVNFWTISNLFVYMFFIKQFKFMQLSPFIFLSLK